MLTVQADFILDKNCEDALVRQQTWNLITKDELAEAVALIEKLARLSPLGYEHINILGRYPLPKK